MGRIQVATILVAVGLMAVSVTAMAGTPEAPEIEDPSGDAIHLEFMNEEPSLDVTKVWFTWADGTLQVHLLIENVEAFGAEGTQDMFDDGTRYDVYWTMDGQDYVARAAFCTPRPAEDCRIPDGEAVFLAGQAMRIDRQLMWDAGTDMHGELEPQEGGVAETGSPGHILINVDPAAVGNPGPGSVLEAPAFSTYVDHHNAGSGDQVGPNFHHPGHVDMNDSAGANYTIPGQGAPAGGQQTDDQVDDESSTVPGAEVLAAIGALVVSGLIAGSSGRRS